MAAWLHRVARDDKGELHFVAARYRPEDMRQRCGMGPIFNSGKSLDDMRNLARQLLEACDKPIINLTEYEYEEGDDDDEEEIRW